MLIHVLIDELGGYVRTVPCDWVTASQIVRAANLAGRGAYIANWTRSETRLWSELLESGEAITASISLFEGTCPCNVKPLGDKIRVLVPLAALKDLGGGQAHLLEPLAPLAEMTVVTFDDSVPQEMQPPNLPHGQATEESDG